MKSSFHRKEKVSNIKDVGGASYKAVVDALDEIE